MSPHPPDVTFLDFFRDTIAPKLEEPRELESVFVGKSKELLDRADEKLNLSQVVSMFGSFVKLVVRGANANTSVPTTSANPPCLNAFEVLLASQRRLTEPSLPKLKQPIQSRTYKLRNDLIGLLEENELSWKACDVPSLGEQLVAILMETLWYVDGHHEVFKSQSIDIPNLFSAFTGYNPPEVSKHRKREVGNLSAEVLQKHSSQLFTCVQCSYWDLPAWHAF